MMPFRFVPLAALAAAALLAVPAHAQFNASLLSAGNTHACAVTATGVLNCWGWNPRGELGTGDRVDRTQPVVARELAGGVKSIGARYALTCAVTRAGAAKCWGRNAYGLGDGERLESTLPADMRGLQSGVESIVVGGRHVCVLTSAGGVTCWGDNADGQFGDGTNNGAYIPTSAYAIGLATGVTAIAAGENFVCALTAAGGVKCFGANASGQLGNGTATASNRPVDVAGLSSGVVAISAFGFHACALLAGGTVRCWGSNSAGQIGDGSPFNTATPRDVPNLAGVSAISAGFDHTCAALASGGLRCWGGNGKGQLGDGTTAGHSSPAPVPGITGRVTALSAAYFFTCANVEGEGVRCWGDNWIGMLGDGTRTDRPVPTPIGPARYAASYQGLWWKSPSGSESGWGVNLSQQGDVLFATWFTYDAQRRGIWLVMPSGTKTGVARYSGPLYRTTGPAFSVATWNSQQVTAVPVGTASFTFADADNATFEYTLDGIAQSRPITRQVFAVAPTCGIGAERSGAPNYQDLWWRAPAGSESGWGLNIAHQGSTIFATWFTYDAQGNGQWLVLPSATGTTAEGFSGLLYRTSGPPFSAVPWTSLEVTATAVGTARLTFPAIDRGTFEYTLDGVTQSKPIVRQVFSAPATVCN